VRDATGRGVVWRMIVVTLAHKAVSTACSIAVTMPVVAGTVHTCFHRLLWSHGRGRHWRALLCLLHLFMYVCVCAVGQSPPCVCLKSGCVLCVVGIDELPTVRLEELICCGSSGTSGLIALKPSTAYGWCICLTFLLFREKIYWGLCDH
jgi:hypothetical protein